MSLDYWNSIYRSLGNIRLGDPRWLDQYMPLIRESENKSIIDLGCGSGTESLYLLNHGLSVISCDFSEAILEKLVSFDQRIKTKKFDLKERFPFEDSEAHLIIASLSLHYFSWSDTARILSEIKRVLDYDGFLICRLNSVNDVNYGAGRGIETEPNYYDMNGNFKRFFDSESIERIFDGWNILIKKECEINRYGKPKKAWEVVVQSRSR